MIEGMISFELNLHNEIHYGISSYPCPRRDLDLWVPLAMLDLLSCPSPLPLPLPRVPLPLPLPLPLISLVLPVSCPDVSPSVDSAVVVLGIV